jgi:hypothetical protein
MLTEFYNYSDFLTASNFFNAVIRAKQLAISQTALQSKTLEKDRHTYSDNHQQLINKLKLPAQV